MKMAKKDAKKQLNKSSNVIGTERNGQEVATEQSRSTRKDTKKTHTQSSHGLCRRCLHSVKYLILILLIPPFLNFTALQKEATALIGDGLPYDIGLGQKLYLKCMGKGKPTVILDAPTGMSSDAWALVQPELAKTTRVCVYDRAGLGFSDRPPYKNESDVDDKTANRWKEFTVERMADDLHKLVTYSSQQERPFIMVGSEIGALIARFYTQLFESDVSDLVLIDPLVEDIFTHDNSIWSHFWFEHLTPSFQTMQMSAAAGVTRLLFLLGLLEHPITGDNIPEEVNMKQKFFMCNPRHLSSVVDEHHFINESFSQMRTISMMKRFPDNVSVTVITGNYYDEQLPSALNKAWAKSQQNLISKLHPGSSHIVVNGADHRMLYRKPEVLFEPIKRLIRQRRSKLPITDSEAS